MKTNYFFTIFFATMIMAAQADKGTLPSGNILMKQKTLKLTENKGQVRGFDGSLHPEVNFIAGSGNLEVFISENGLSYQFLKNNYNNENAEHGSVAARPKGSKKRPGLISSETFRIDMQLENANRHLRITREGKSTSFMNYYSKGVLDVHTFDKITYHNVYNGIDWTIYTNGDQFKYDFIVHPGADPGQIKLKFGHQEGLSLNRDGSFSINCRLGIITEQKPESYQGNTAIKTEFILENNTIKFNVAKYDQSKELIIDPAVIWSTFFGGFIDQIYDCVTDKSANVYIAGVTGGGNLFPPGGHQQTFGGGGSDAFLAKFDPTGVLLWGTYYGGDGFDEGLSCTVDASDNVFLCGTTESTAGIASGGHDNSLDGIAIDGFLAKFASNGTLQWGTYYGGSDFDFGTDCAADNNGNIYLVGYTFSSNGISTTGAHKTTLGGIEDMYLVKFNGFGVRQWGTYFGGANDEDGIPSCATDPSGNIFLSGATNSSNFITNGHQTFFGGGSSDAFLAKFNAAGVISWSTYYGGSGTDRATGCATDSQGNCYLTGTTDSQSGIFYQGFKNYFTSMPKTDDGFLVRFNANGVRQWGTYYGGSGTEENMFCLIDKNDNVYLGGATNSINQIASGEYLSTKGSNKDGFIVKMTSSGNRTWGMYVAGANEDYAWAGAIDANNELYVAGYTRSKTEFGLNGHQNVNNGVENGFLTKYCNGEPPAQLGAISGNSVQCEFNKVTFSVAPSAEALSYVWQINGQIVGPSANNTVAVIIGTAGVGPISVSASGTCGLSEPSYFSLDVKPSPQIQITASSSLYCTGTVLQLSAAGADSYTWSAGGMLPTQTVSPHQLTVYTVTGVNSHSCTSSALYTVIPNTTTAFNFTTSGLTASLSISNMACSSFTWDYGNGTGSVLNTNPVVTYQGNGTYGVCLKCNDLPNGCIRCINITVPGNRIDGVDISEVQPSSFIQVYPNPGEGVFNVMSSFKGEGIITNALGQTIMKVIVLEGENKIDLRENVQGIYLLQISGDRHTFAAKLVKE
jgi:hypothetical protein